MIAACTSADSLGATPLPRLRAELELLPGTVDAHGQPTWLIHDPLVNRFTQIEPAAREALRHWTACSKISELVERVAAEGRVHLDVPAVAALIDFLYAAQLTERPKSGGWQGFVKARAARKHSLPAWLVHNYLFVRIPLARPQAMLERLLPSVRVLWSPFALWLFAGLGLVGLYLASRQWEVFMGTLMGYFSWDGVLAGALALALVKVAHELGHAFAAVAFGCRVHSMGIAFVVMAPMPYTDVTDAWRLTDRRQRLLIDSAGMIAEAMIAAVALLVWSILPDGPVRSAMFVVSVVSIVSSLAINLNPFMRFDGYYLLSEILGVDNLQCRSFAIGCWKLREILFGLGAPPPENMPRRRIAVLAIYAWSVWVYRLVLFTGIALLVYHYFFKALGILLFAVEIIYFIARPIARELNTWWRMKGQILPTRRTKQTLSGVCVAMLLVLVPWSTTVEIPAVLEAAQLQSLYPPRSARVTSVKVQHGDAVTKGQVIATLSSSDIDDDLRRARIALRLAELQYGRRMTNPADRESSLVIEGTILALRSKIEGLERERGELTIIAPFDGRIVDLNPEVLTGRWLSQREPIAIVAGGQELVAKGYAPGEDIGRIAEGAEATFIPEHPSRSRVALRISRIATAGATQIEIADLASTNAGRIAVVADERRRLVPVSAHYLVLMTADALGAEADLSVRGVALAQGRAESLLARTWRRALGVLIRESGA